MKLLMIGIRMNMGGTEKAMLGYLDLLSREGHEVTLLLAENEGPLWVSLPSSIRVLPPITNGCLFSLSRENALVTWKRLHFRGKRTFLLRHARLFFSLLLQRRGCGERLFLTLMKEAILPFSCEYGDAGGFDAALAFSGDRTMFYLVDKVKVPRKISWLHFDYRYPTRDDRIYAHYFARCDHVISVAKSCTQVLKERFPALRERFVTRYNPLPKDLILSKAKEPTPLFDDGFFGPRILSVMRICYQKGYDRIPQALYDLRARGIYARWYVMGNGSPKEMKNMRRQICRFGVENGVILCGNVENPYPYMKACDLFVLPSRYEGMPITVEEAKLLACPIVVTEYHSAREQLDNGRLGAIVGAERLSSAIFEILNKRENVNIM